MASRPNVSNEIHDLDVVTAQNLAASPNSFGVVPTRSAGAGVHRRRIAELFPPFLFKKVVSEVISTFLLVFMTCGAGAINKRDPSLVSQLGASVAGGLIVTVMIYAVGHISGAHMNPAVTLAFAVARHFPWIQVPFYWASQITGATIASFILRGVLHPWDDLGTTTPSHAAWRAFITEVVVTFNMMFVTLAVATDTRAVGELAGLAVGSAVCITSIFAGPISGGSMNPARTLGPALASGIYDSLWVYFIAPPIGTILGALAYNFIRLRPDGGQSQSPSKSPSLKMRRLKKMESEIVIPPKEEGDLEDGSV